MRDGLCDEWRLNMFLILRRLGEMTGMEMSEHNTIAAYISEIDRIYRTGKATEHTYRGVLQQTLSALMPGFTILNEPKKQECGAPDYIITDRAGRSISFVEAKDIGDADLDGSRRAGHKEQFDRYKASLDTIAFTDYLDFHLYLNGRSAGSVRIGEERDGRIVAVPEKFGEFLLLVEALATAHPVKITSAKQLAQLMAGKARMLQRIAEAYLQPGCRVFYSDLWGLRRDKFAALETATMESIKWQELAPVEPMLFFVPKDTAGESEYNKGFRIEELMAANGMGVTSAHDSFVIGSREELLKRFSEFQSSLSHENLYAKFNVKEKAGWDINKGYH